MIAVSTGRGKATSTKELTTVTFCHLVHDSLTLLIQLIMSGSLASMDLTWCWSGRSTLLISQNQFKSVLVFSKLQTL